MRNNRRGFVVGGAAGLTALLAPNVAQACFCRRCRHAAAQPTTCVAPSSFRILNTIHCPSGLVWSTTIPPLIPDALNMTAKAPHAFTIYGAGLYANFVGGVTFIALISDPNDSSVVWGSYNYPPVTQGAAGKPDSFKFYATETGSTPGTTSTLNITVTLGTPYNTCPGIYWGDQAIKYA